MRCRRVASICLKSAGTLEAHCRCRDVEVWRCRGMEIERSGAREVRCRRADVEVFASRALEVWRCAASVLPLRGMEVWRCAAGVGTSRYGDLEACCACRDVYEFASRVLEMRCRRCLKKEVWSSSVLFVVVGISSFRSSKLLGKTLAICVSCAH